MKTNNAMKKMWIEKLRERFADRQMPPPDGLWDDISAAMSNMDKTDVQPESETYKPKTVLMTLRRIAACAACAVVMVSLWFVVEGDSDGRLSEKDGFTSSLSGTKKVSETKNTSENAEENDVLNVLPDKINSVMCAVASDLRERLQDVKSAEEEQLLADNESRIIDDKGGEEGRKVNNSPDKTKESRRYNHSELLNSPDLMALHDKKENTKTLSLSAHVSGMAAVNGMSNNSNGYGKAFVSSDGVILGENIFSVMQLSNSDEMKNNMYSTVNVKHNLPIKAGVSLKYGLTKRLAVSSGVNYSYLSSDITSGDEGQGLKTEQTLHYVSVPLGVSYEIFSSGRLDVYASGGVEAAFCVSGKADTKCLVDDKVVSRSKEDVKDSKPQWSVNAAAGVQYNITDKIGVYVEPGVGYYFDNGSSTNTIYKDRPFDFNLNVGLRFSVK